MERETGIELEPLCGRERSRSTIAAKQEPAGEILSEAAAAESKDLL